MGSPWITPFQPFRMGTDLRNPEPSNGQNRRNQANHVAMLKTLLWNGKILQHFVHQQYHQTVRRLKDGDSKDQELYSAAKRFFSSFTKSLAANWFDFAQKSRCVLALSCSANAWRMGPFFGRFSNDLDQTDPIQRREILC